MILEIVLATIAGFFAGMLWYADFLFGPRWRELVGMTDKKMEAAKKKLAHNMVCAVIVAIVTASVLSYFFARLGVVRVPHALLVGFLVWVGFQAPAMIQRVLWEKTPHSLFFINAGNQLFITLVMSVVIVLV